MSKFFRFLTRRKKSNKKDNVDNSMKSRTKDSDLEVVITHLDNNEFKFYIPKKSVGKTLEAYAFQNIDLPEDQNYFGLQFTDNKNISQWLDISKQTRKQMTIGPPYSLHFRVKFFSSDPVNQLKNEYARYLFVMQLKQQILEGTLVCDDQSQAAELAALSLHEEHGDYEEDTHTPAFVSQFRFLPVDKQTEEFELLVLTKYKLLRNRGLIPASTDRLFIEKCKSLPDYGVDRHDIKGKNGKDYVLGLTPSGLLIYEEEIKIGLFPWSQVSKLAFKNNSFTIVVIDIQENEDGDLQHTFVFFSEDAKSCKQMWKSCVEHHAFYRLEGAHKPPSQIQRLFRLKSRFYASSRTEYQMSVKSTFGNTTKPNSRFKRANSARCAPRESFEKKEAERRKIQQKYRDENRENNNAAAMEQSRKAHLSKQSSGYSEESSGPSTPAPTPTKRDLAVNLRQSNTPKVLTPIVTVNRPKPSHESLNGADSDLGLRQGIWPFSRESANSNNIGNYNNKTNHVTNQTLPSHQSSTDESAAVNLQSGSYSPEPELKSVNSHRPGYAPMPPKRNIKPPTRTSNQRDPEQIILV